MRSRILLFAVILITVHSNILAQVKDNVQVWKEWNNRIRTFHIPDPLFEKLFSGEAREVTQKITPYWVHDHMSGVPTFALQYGVEYRISTLYERWAAWQSTYGYIENIGAAIALTLGHARAANRSFNITESTSVTQREWANRFADELSWAGVIETTDDPDHPFARRTGGLNLAVPLRISGRRFREALGFSDVVDEPTALAGTIESEASA